TQGVRKITVQYAKRVVGRKMYGGQTQYMPLKVNYAGVMPIIFAWALLLFPTTIVSYGFRNSPTAARIASALSTGWPHYVVLAGMIFFFSYFWVATQFQPADFGPDTVWASCSLDGGKTYDAPVNVINDPEALSDSYCDTIPGGTRIVQSGPHAGRIYVAWLGADPANAPTGCNYSMANGFHDVWVA